MTDKFTARVRLVAALAVIELVGELDADTAHTLEDRLDGVVAQVPGDVVLDCVGLVFIDSSGLNVMKGARNRVTAAGRNLWIHAPPATFRRLLTITGLDSILPTIDALPSVECTASTDARNRSEP